MLRNGGIDDIFSDEVLDEALVLLHDAVELLLSSFTILVAVSILEALYLVDDPQI